MPWAAGDDAPGGGGMGATTVDLGPRSGSRSKTVGERAGSRASSSGTSMERVVLGAGSLARISSSEGAGRTRNELLKPSKPASRAHTLSPRLYYSVTRRQLLACDPPFRSARPPADSCARPHHLQQQQQLPRTISGQPSPRSHRHPWPDRGRALRGRSVQDWVREGSTSLTSKTRSVPTHPLASFPLDVSPDPPCADRPPPKYSSRSNWPIDKKRGISNRHLLPFAQRARSLCWSCTFSFLLHLTEDSAPELTPSTLSTHLGRRHHVDPHRCFSSLPGSDRPQEADHDVHQLSRRDRHVWSSHLRHRSFLPFLHPLRRFPDMSSLDGFLLTSDAVHLESGTYVLHGTSRFDGVPSSRRRSVSHPPTLFEKACTT